jgi:hypothetical protein
MKRRELLILASYDEARAVCAQQKAMPVIGVSFSVLPQ